MKRIICSFGAALLLTTAASAQSPNLIHYQAAIRNSSGAPLSSSSVPVRFTIHDLTAGGAIVFRETNTATTNAQGIINLSIGSGTAVTGTLAAVNWASGAKFLEVEVDAGSGLVSIGTQQLVSVPYALNAGNVPWTISGSVIYNSNTGEVGLGTSTPSKVTKFHVSGVGSSGGSAPIYNNTIMATSSPSTGTDNSGVYGEGNWRGLFGRNKGTVSRTSALGVYGLVDSAKTYTSAAYGVYGEVSATGNAGSSNYGVYGVARNGSSGNYSIYGANPGGGGSDYAAYFNGKTFATNFTASVKAFTIDHPQDPTNKYLVHSSIESNDMMNIYNGNVITNASGEASVTLPAYFTALNKDFKYQLTCIGTFAQAIVAEEVRDNMFKIKTDKPNVRVSWQIAGVRQDAVANYYRIVNEVEKPANEKGFYLVPEAYGKGPEMNASYKSQSQNGNK